MLQSRASLVSSSDGGILAEGETSSESSGGSNSPPCDLGLVERLLRTHPVWFLPGIQRAGAVHLLQGKEEGVSFFLFYFYFFYSYCFFLRRGKQKTYVKEITRYMYDSR